MEEIITALVTGIVAILAALVSLVVSRINAERVRGELDSLKNALEEGGGVYYIICPSCGKKIYLSGVQIHAETKENE